jgi:hypothetical protein
MAVPRIKNNFLGQLERPVLTWDPSHDAQRGSVRRVFSALSRRIRSNATGSVQTPSALPASRGLFVIGAPRSGTTVLQGALNDSPDVFLLGEANLHLEAAEPNFAGRYNAWHDSLSHQKTKGTFCPPILKVDGTSEEYLNGLGQSYKWVGAKIVVNNLLGPDWVGRLKRYHCGRFYQARYLFTFRHPLAVICSTRDLQLLTGHQLDSVARLLDNYLETMELFLCAVRNLAHTRAVFHEDVSPAELQRIGVWLDIDLSGSAAYYDGTRVRGYDAATFDGDDRLRIERVAELYADLRREARAGFATPQVEQMDNHLSPRHHTALGRIDRDVRSLRQGVRA